MKLSIITTSLNSAKTIEDTLKSVANQTYLDIEHIIIDGKSTDGTLDIVKKFTQKTNGSDAFGNTAHITYKVLSEKDGGIYDAINKGIGLATGDIIGILNSDDFYTSNDVIATVINRLKESNVDCVWGDLIIVDKNNVKKIIRNWKSAPYEENSFQKGWHPPHPTIFFKKTVYEKYGLFRTDLSTYADYELMLRFLVKNKINSSYISKTLVTMRNGGASSKSYYNWIKANIGCYRSFKLNNLKISPLFIIRKPFLKLEQFF